MKKALKRQLNEDMKDKEEFEAPCKKDKFDPEPAAEKPRMSEVPIRCKVGKWARQHQLAVEHIFKKWLTVKSQ